MARQPLDEITKNCSACGREFRDAYKARNCPACRAPRTRRAQENALTAREKQIADLVRAGFSNKRIALELRLAERTITTYMSVIFQKLGVANRTGLAVWALKQSSSQVEGVFEMKLKVTCTYNQPSHEGNTLHFRPVFSGSAENAAVFNGTPCGEFELAAVTDAVAAQFAVGSEYTVTFASAGE